MKLIKYSYSMIQFDSCFINCRGNLIEKSLKYKMIKRNKNSIFKKSHLCIEKVINYVNMKLGTGIWGPSGCGRLFPLFLHEK